MSTKADKQNKTKLSQGAVPYPRPMIDKPSGGLRISRFALLAFVLVAVIAYLTLYSGGDRNTLLLGMLGVLAMLGVVFLLAGAIGFIGPVDRSATNDFAKAFIDGVNEGLVVTDADSRIVYANSAYGHLIGASQPKDIRTVERIFSRDPEAAEVVYRLANAVRTGQSMQGEVRLSAPLAQIAQENSGQSSGPKSGQSSSQVKGGARWYRLRARPFALEGRPNKLSAWQVQDITADRNHQERLFQNLQYAIDYLDHAPAGFFSANADGSIVYVNATLADWLQLDLTRFAPGQLNLRDLMIGDGEALLSTVRPKPGETRTATIDLELARADGMAVPVRLFHMVPVASDGAPGATRTIVLNRSEEIEGLDAGSSRAAEIRFNRFFNSTPIAIASLDADGAVQRSNAAFLKLFNRGNNDGVTPGDSLSSALTESSRPSFDAALQRALDGYSDIDPVEASLVSDTDCYLRVYVSGVGAADAEPEGGLNELAIIYVVEMTEQRALEEQFAKGQRMQAVGQLAGGIAHDFNNVLTGIIGFSDLLLTRHRASDPSFTDIMAIKQNANRAAGLVRQLLAFSRRQTLQPEVLNVPDQLEEVSMLMRRLLGEKATLDIVQARELWPIKADAGQFEQVVVNLTVNARDAMPDGGKLTIATRNLNEVEAQALGHRELAPADYVVLSVSDTGTGMPADVLEKIFEPFFSTKEVGKGTGLGLSTVYGIVKQSGGFIYCESVEGEGTTFNIFFPRHIPTTEEIEEAEAPPTVVQEKDLTGNASILVVEDEDAVRAFAERALQSRGHTVHTAITGLEGVEMMEELDGKVDLIVSDVMMPEMDGPAMYAQLRETYGDVPIIFASGYAEDAFERNLPDGVEFKFLAKPYTLKQLATAVKEALDTQRSV
ncbi:MAG: ATP-binding protein [Pseudomonadota bacterium]